MTLFYTIIFFDPNWNLDRHFTAPSGSHIFKNWNVHRQNVSNRWWAPKFHIRFSTTCKDKHLFPYSSVETFSPTDFLLVPLISATRPFPKLSPVSLKVHKKSSPDAQKSLIIFRFKLFIFTPSIIHTSFLTIRLSLSLILPNHFYIGSQIFYTHPVSFPPYLTNSFYSPVSSPMSSRAIWSRCRILDPFSSPLLHRPSGLDHEIESEGRREPSWGPPYSILKKALNEVRKPKKHT